MLTTYDLLVFLHVALFVYWLGPDWGVYLTSPAIWRKDLSVGERMRRARLVVQMAQISRNSLILLLPVGLTMAAMLGLSPLTGSWLVGVWALCLAWLVASLIIYKKAGTGLARALTVFDQGLRWVLLFTLVPIGVYAFITYEIFDAQWIAAKLALFGLLIGNSLQQRAIALKWVAALRDIDAGQNIAAAEQVFENTARRSQINAYGTWSISLLIAFFGVTKYSFY